MHVREILVRINQFNWICIPSLIAQSLVIETVQKLNTQHLGYQRIQLKIWMG